MHRASNLVLLLLISFALPACDLVGDIFEFGLWVGITIVVAFVLLVGWLMRKFRGPKV